MEIVNIERLTEASLIKLVAARLEEILKSVGWLKDWSIETEVDVYGKAFDLLCKIVLPEGGSSAIYVECKKELRPSQLPSLIETFAVRENQNPLEVRALALPWVSPRMRELCKEKGWSWLDLAGNYRLEIPGFLLIENMGNPPIHESRKAKVNLGSPETGRILRVLLLPENIGINWTQRGIQKECRPEVSLGLVNKVVRHLADESYVEATGGGGFHLLDPERLLFAWRDAYRFDRQERQGYFTLMSGKKLRDALALLGASTEGKAAYAAFSAADFQAPNVRQAKTWLYMSHSLEDEFRSLLEAKPVESGENIIVVFPVDDGVFFHSDMEGANSARPHCTNLVQTFVDLYNCGGRGAEAAEALLNQRLRPAWKAGGIAR